MNTEQMSALRKRAAVHGALSDPARLRIMDILSAGDVSPSELSGAVDMPSNLLAHHLNVLRRVGLLASQRSQGDRRRQYLRLVEQPYTVMAPQLPTPTRVLFVCTANTARSHLAVALWRRSSDIPSTSAGTHPADRIDPRAIEVAGRHGLPLPRRRPRRLDEVITAGDLVITVCDLAHEELSAPNELHWSVPDPVRVGTAAAFDAAYDEIEGRVLALLPRLAS